jgi:hypothetical protein
LEKEQSDRTRSNQSKEDCRSRAKKIVEAEQRKDRSDSNDEIEEEGNKKR